MNNQICNQLTKVYQTGIPQKIEIKGKLYNFRKLKQGEHIDIPKKYMFFECGPNGGKIGKHTHQPDIFAELVGGQEKPKDPDEATPKIINYGPTLSGHQTIILNNQSKKMPPISSLGIAEPIGFDQLTNKKTLALFFSTTPRLQSSLKWHGDKIKNILRKVDPKNLIILVTTPTGDIGGDVVLFNQKFLVVKAPFKAALGEWDNLPEIKNNIRKLLG